MERRRKRETCAQRRAKHERLIAEQLPEIVVELLEDERFTEPLRVARQALATGTPAEIERARHIVTVTLAQAHAAALDELRRPAGALEVFGPFEFELARIRRDQDERELRRRAALAGSVRTSSNQGARHAG